MSNERGNLLYLTGRHDLAEREFRATLAQEPSNAMAHAMIGLCMLKKKAYSDATAAAQEAIQLRPDWAFGYAALASVLEERERLPQAVAAIEQAIALDPFNPSNLALLADIRLKQNKWSDALSAADRGLEIDPQHAGSLNARGVALVQLGRRGEASATIQGALARDPHNAVTHANQGWALLHSGDHRAALEHFREALRIQPEMQWAKAGIVEAMKARNPIYRMMLRYFLFMSRLSSRAQWGIMLGGWIGYQILLQLKEQNPAIGPYALPLMIAYVVFAIMTWLAAPGFNLMLRLNRFGRYALSRDQTIASNWFGGCIALAIGLGIAAYATREETLLIAALMTGLMTIPITSTFRCPPGWPRRAMAGYSTLLAAVGLLYVGLNDPALRDRIANVAGITQVEIFNLFLIGLLLSSFIANALVMARVKK